MVPLRFVSFRFVGFDAGRPLVRGTSFWGFRTNVPIQWLPRTHWAIWSIRQEGSTPVLLSQNTESEFRNALYLVGTTYSTIV